MNTGRLIAYGLLTGLPLIAIYIYLASTGRL